MNPIHQRKKYDSTIIWLYANKKEHLLLSEFRKTIPYSTIHGFRHTSYSTYYGAEFQFISKEALDYYEILEQNRQLKKMIVTFTKTWFSLSSVLLPILQKKKENKSIFLDAIQRLSSTIPLKKSIGIYPNVYSWIPI